MISHSVLYVDRSCPVVILRLFKNAWFQRFARKEDIHDSALIDAVMRAERGVIDANLGGGLIKQRIARRHGGKSGGYRTIVIFRARERAVFVFAFSKSRQANLSAHEEDVYRKAAKLVLGLSDEQMTEEVRAGRLMEIDYDQNT